VTNQSLSRRHFLQRTGMMVTGTLLAACTKTGETPLPEGGDIDTVTLTLGLIWETAFQATQQAFDDQFMATHPEIQIETIYNSWADHNNMVPAWAAADTLPDLIYVHGGRAFPWAFAGITLSLQSYLDADEPFDLPDVWAEALELYTFKGEQHGIPYDHGPNLLGYNKDIFDAAGVGYPDERWTMETLRENAFRLTDRSRDLPQWGWSAEMPALANQDGVSTLGPWGVALLNAEEDTLLLDSTAARTAIQYWLDLILVDRSAPTAAEAAAFEGDLWQAGQVAMAVVPSWETPSLAASSTFAWDVAPWPTGPVTRATGAFGSGFSLTKKTQQPDLGWTYLRDYLSRTGMEFMWGLSGRGSPARKSAYQSWMDSEVVPEHAHYYLDALDTYAITGRPYQTLAAAELTDLITSQVALLKNDEIDLESAIAVMMDEGTALLAAAHTRLQGA